MTTAIGAANGGGLKNEKEGYFVNIRSSESAASSGAAGQWRGDGHQGTIENEING